MADYLPVNLPGQGITRVASAAITGGQLVQVAGATGSVAPAAANAVNWLGVAAFDAVTGDNVTVFCDGVHEVIASGAITGGDLLVPAANGQVASIAAVSTPTPADVTATRAVVGVALNSAINGAKVRVKFSR